MHQTAVSEIIPLILLKQFSCKYSFERDQVQTLLIFYTQMIEILPKSTFRILYLVLQEL